MAGMNLYTEIMPTPDESLCVCGGGGGLDTDTLSLKSNKRPGYVSINK